MIQHLKLPTFTYFQSNLRWNTVCIVKWPECHTNVKTTQTWDAESHPKFAIELKYTVSGVTFDEELLCAIGNCIRPSVQELRGWARLKVNTEGLVLEKSNVCYKNQHHRVIQHLHFTYFQSNLRWNTVCIVKWPEWDAESHPMFAIELKYTVSGVTFDEELLVNRNLHTPFGSRVT